MRVARSEEQATATHVEHSEPIGDIGPKFPTGVHRGRTPAAVAIFDPYLEPGLYVTVRARHPRTGWPEDLVDEVRRVARDLKAAA